MDFEDQRRWFVTSPSYFDGDGAPRQDVTMVDAVSPRQAVVIAVKQMRALPSGGWPAAARAKGLDPVVDMLACPADEDDVALKISTGMITLPARARREAARR